MRFFSASVLAYSLWALANPSASVAAWTLGEVVASDSAGVPDFAELHRRRGSSVRAHRWQANGAVTSTYKNL
jgi:hypothetical protein